MLKLPAGPASIKTQWRVTHFCNPTTGSPQTYKVERTLHRQATREGIWRIVRGLRMDQHAIVYQLSATKPEAEMFILKRDANIFFMDHDRGPLVGPADFCYAPEPKKWRIGRTIGSRLAARRAEGRKSSVIAWSSRARRHADSTSRFACGRRLSWR